MPDKLLQHLYDKHGYTWCGRLWQAAYGLPNRRTCQTCINRKENWERRFETSDEPKEEV